MSDIKSLLDNRTVGASLYGATNAERASVIAGKLTHYGEHTRAQVLGSQLLL
jgi:fatty acid desaturase (delta-4 desaturase)